MFLQVLAILSSPWSCKLSIVPGVSTWPGQGLGLAGMGAYGMQKEVTAEQTESVNLSPEPGVPLKSALEPDLRPVRLRMRKEKKARVCSAE